MKVETLVLVGVAAAVGWHMAKRKTASAASAAPAQAPQVIERVYVEEYPYPYPSWGYPVWGGFRGGHRHHHHHGGGGGGRGGGRGGRGGRR